MIQPFDTLILFFGTAILLALAPGPDNLFVLAQAMQRGRMAGIVVTFGLCIGIVFHTLAVALGVAALFQASVFAFNLLKYIGAAYLVFLAYTAFKAGNLDCQKGQQQDVPFNKLFRRGVIMNVTNPKVSIFFLAFLPQFTSPAHGPLFPQFLILGLLFIVATIVVFGVISLLAGSIGHRLRSSEKATTWLNCMAGTVFVLLALKLAVAKQ